MSIRVLPMALHSVSASVMIWGYDQLSTIVNHTLIKQQVGGHFQYLTIQGLTMACITMLLGFCADLFPTVKGLRKAQRIVMIVALQVCVTVSTIYWSLILIAPKLILPPAPNAVPSSSSAAELLWIPLKHDLALHAVPALALLIDFIAYHEAYTPGIVNLGASSLAAIAGTGYALWIEHCASYNKTFPYPFLTENPWNIRIGIYAAATTLALVSFRIVNFLHPTPGRERLTK